MIISDGTRVAALLDGFLTVKLEGFILRKKRPLIRHSQLSESPQRFLRLMVLWNLSGYGFRFYRTNWAKNDNHSFIVSEVLFSIKGTKADV